MDFDVLGKFSKRLEDWKANGSFTQSATEKISAVLKTASKEFLKKAGDLEKEKKAIIEKNSKNQQEALDEIAKKEKAEKEAIEKKKQQRQNAATAYQEGYIKKQLKACDSWSVLTQWICKAYWSVVDACVEIFGKSLSAIIAEIEKLVVDVKSQINRIWTSVTSEVKVLFETSNKTIEEMFNKAASIVADLINKLVTETFVVHSAGFSATVADLKELKGPYLEVDLTFFGKRQKIKIQFDAKNFINTLAEGITKQASSEIQEEIDKTIKNAEQEVTKTEKKSDEKIKEAEKESQKKVAEFSKKAEAAA